MANLKGLLLVGQDSHKYHDLKGNSGTLSRFLSDVIDIDLTVTEDQASLEAPVIDQYDVLILNTFEGEGTAEQLRGLLGAVSGGKGLVALHAATIFSAKNPDYVSMVGGTFKGHAHYAEFPVAIKDNAHPITKGMADFRISDELYATNYAPDVEWLATAVWENQEYPLVWTKTYGKGRVCYIALGHDAAAFNDPNFRTLVVRAVQWVTGK